MDGAMGTELLRRGISVQELAFCNLTHPEMVTSVHQAYCRAGAEVLLTNTFQVNPFTLPDQGQEICQSAIRLARAACPEVWVLGSIGPIQRNSTEVDFSDEKAFRTTLDWLSGVDGFLLETASDESVFQACRWARKHAPHMPMLISLAFQKTPAGELRTRAGQSPGEIARLAQETRPDALGVNCGLNISIDEIAEILSHYRSNTNLPLFARPNAGSPIFQGGNVSYPHLPETLATALPQLFPLAMIGGCCGTTPDTIAAFRSIALEAGF